MSVSRSGLLNRAINALPFELFRATSFAARARLTKRLARDDEGINLLDAACREHDIAYSRSNDLTDRHAADKVFVDKALGRVVARDSALSETAKIDMDMKPKKKTTKKKVTKKRILLTAKRDGALPFLPILGALGSLIDGAASVAKAVNDSKAARCQLEELQRHDRAMEQGHRLYFGPYKHGCSCKEKKNVEKTIKMPSGATTNVQLNELARRMRVPYFRDVFMRNTLPMSGAHRNESGIVNLDNATGPGTHWIAYAKRNNRVSCTLTVSVIFDRPRNWCDISGTMQ